MLTDNSLETFENHIKELFSPKNQVKAFHEFY